MVINKGRWQVPEMVPALMVPVYQGQTLIHACSLLLLPPCGMACLRWPRRPSTLLSFQRLCKAEIFRRAFLQRDWDDWLIEEVASIKNSNGNLWYCLLYISPPFLLQCPLPLLPHSFITTQHALESGFVCIISPPVL